MSYALDIYIANAGVGKTRVLLEQVEKHLQEGVQPERIAFVTFTRAGASVGRLRTAESLGIPLSRLSNFRTIHSLAFRGVAAKKDLMMDNKRYLEFGQQAGYKFGMQQASDGTSVFEYSKDSCLVSMEQLYRVNKPYCESIMDNKVDYGRLSQYIMLYQKFKSTFGYKDFTDLLEEYIAKDLCEDVDVVCLDEMQDSSYLQWQLVMKAFRNVQHMYIAGDPRQCIYRYAGASPTTLLKLRGEQHILDKSYRVPSRIVTMANHIINNMSSEYNMGKFEGIHEGGTMKYVYSMEDFTSKIDLNKTYFFLARNRRFFPTYIEWCTNNALPYKLMGAPVFTDTDKMEFRDNKVDDWPADKLDFAQRCHNAGTFYAEPCINISTIHGVKGDEADIVLLMSDMSKLSAKALSEDEDGEHCIFYVGVTRAKHELYIMQPQTKTYYPYLF